MLSVSELVLSLVAVLALIGSLFLMFRKGSKNAKIKLVSQIIVFASVFAIALLMQVSSYVTLAQDVADAGIASSQGLGFIAAAIATAASSIGAGIAVAAAAPAAIGAISEDSKNFGKAIIFVALGEGVAIYGLLISILIINKL